MGQLCEIMQENKYLNEKNNQTYRKNGFTNIISKNLTKYRSKNNFIELSK